jgi:hypothetical protein
LTPNAEPAAHSSLHVRHDADISTCPHHHTTPHANADDDGAMSEMPRPPPRPSFSSRTSSFAISTTAAEHGQPRDEPAAEQIDEIEAIRRYEDFTTIGVLPLPLHSARLFADGIPRLGAGCRACAAAAQDGQADNPQPALWQERFFGLAPQASRVV